MASCSHHQQFKGTTDFFEVRLYQVVSHSKGVDGGCLQFGEAGRTSMTEAMQCAAVPTAIYCR